MLWRNKILLCASCLFLTVGCGFSPVYSTEKNEPTSLSMIDITGLSGREGSWLLHDLEDAFNSTSIDAEKKYILNPQLQMDSLPVLVEPNGKIHRYRIKITSHFTLKQKQNLALVEEGTLTRTVSYNVSDSDYSSFVAPQDAIKRGLHEIAGEYATRFSSFFSRLTQQSN